MRGKILMGVSAFALLSSVALTYYAAMAPGEDMTSAAKALVASLDAEQKKSALMEFGTPDRLGWHFIPKDFRKGLQLNDMNDDQRAKTHSLLKAALSEMGYQKASQIMGLEKVLNEFEAGKGRWDRDPLRYYLTLFGNPAEDTKWGLSFEGHHLSLNFVVEDGRLSATTPQFFAANPAIVQNENSAGVAVGTRVLKNEETMAFELVQTLSPKQQAVAIFANKAPKEIREAGSPQPPQDEPEGIPYSDLNVEQRNLLLTLIQEYAMAMPTPIAKKRVDQLHYDGLDKIHFAWAGATQPGIGHYYRIQGPSFLIELVNTQPDSAGNPANHIHSVWRDMHGDFAVPIDQGS